MTKQSIQIFARFKWEWMTFAAASLFLATLFGYYLFQHHNLIITQEKESLIHSATTSEVIISSQLEDINTTFDNLRVQFTHSRVSNKKTKDEF